MDIAAMSIILNHNQLRMDASLAVMNQTKQLVQQQGEQLVEMLEQSTAQAPHPTHGGLFDTSI